MPVLKKFRRFAAVSDEPHLVKAQAHDLSHQIPLLYCMLLSNTLLLAWTHFGTAPWLLTVVVPAILTLACAVRLVFWWKKREAEVDPVAARQAIKAMVGMSAVLAVGFTSWSLSLYPFGNAYQQAHIAFYMGITTIGCIFCLSKVRPAALTVGGCVLVPFVCFFGFSGNPVFGAMAINMVLVIAVLTVILLNKYADFEQLLASRNAIARRQEETQRLSDENYRLANVDSLTGLPNWRQFTRRLEQIMGDAAAAGRTVAVCMINIDGFKQINETFGHPTGDRLLLEVARRIEAIQPVHSIVARAASDTFAMVLPIRPEVESLEMFGAHLAQTLRQPVVLKEATLHTSSTSGFAISQPGDSWETLFDRADYATSVAKRESRGRAVIFSERHALEIKKVRQLEHALHTADLEEEIYVLFQPQVDVVRNRLSGYEVLARWRSPELGEVSPSEFIPLAERVGLVTKITQTVLCKALAATAKLPAPLRLSVNLSAHDLASPTAIEQIATQVALSGKPCRIDFEITETAVMRDLKQANDALLVLLSLGARIALDDFGTGHSSLTHVQQLPLDRIKIDRSFVAEVTSDPTSRAIIKTMVDLCRNLGITCVIEGIETEEQLESLLALGGTIMQGYLFGPPMPEEVLLVSLAAGQNSAEQARAAG